MKKLTISLIVFFGINILINAQTVFKSYSMLKRSSEYVTDKKDRVITITDKEITITNFNEGGTLPLNLVVNKIEKKEFDFNPDCKWYYCTKKGAAPNSPSSKSIVIVRSSHINLFVFFDEVTVFEYQFLKSL